MNHQLLINHCIDSDDIADKVYKSILHTARTAIKQRQRFNCVLAGGSTPQKIYKKMVTADLPWEYCHFYLGDERVLDENDKQRNSVMIEESWLNQLKIKTNWYPIPAQLGQTQAVQQYTELLATIEQFDLVLLGMGEDGHTASLFPGHHHPSNQSVLAVHHSPKPPPDRISLSIEQLCKTREMLLLISGQSKRTAMEQWLNGDDLPIAQVVIQALKNARVELFLDKAANPGI